MHSEYDFSAATGAAREKMQQAVSSARQRADDVVASGARCLQERPATSLLTVFAVGVAVGAVIAAATRPAPRFLPAAVVDDSRTRLAEILGTVASNLRGPLSKTCASVGEGASSLTESVTRALEKIHPPKKFGWW